MTSMFEYPSAASVPCDVGPGPVTCHLAEPDGAARGWAVLIHGRNGAAAQPHMVAIAQAYLARGWRVAVPDLPFSDATPGSGPAGALTMAAHHAAARSVLRWLSDHDGKAAAIALCGHSLGAYAIARLADAQPGVHHLMAVSPVLSGQALLDARAAMGGDALEALAREAPELYATMAAESAASALGRLAAPLAVMTGALDGLTPPAHARAYFAAAPDARFFSVLPGQHHCPEGPVFAEALHAAFTAVEA